MSPVSINDVLLAVQSITRIGVRELKGNGQSPHIRQARLLAYFVAADCFNIPVADIGPAMSRSRKTLPAVLRRLRSKRVLDPDVIDLIEVEALAFASARLAGHATYAGYSLGGAA